jgi:hypothetical protein
VGWVIPVFLFTFLFCPWLWKPLSDGYYAYSGVVVDKGTEIHLITFGCEELKTRSPTGWVLANFNETGPSTTIPLARKLG